MWCAAVRRSGNVYYSVFLVFSHDQLIEFQIVGGNVTSLYDYPWAALLRYHSEQKRTDSWGCSGAYIGYLHFLPSIK